ncbi:glycosyltransferase family 87 protein [Streptomyces sp. NPDC006798]|uniref:glycosyltransferase family 87 protein n=1 Tax=Streptomyces sp. NPDC006798 TaxID=3155462 RepID=UPI0033CB433A
MSDRRYGDGPARESEDRAGPPPSPVTPGALAGIAAVWSLTRAGLLLCVFRVVVPPGPDVTSDVSVIYRGWYEVLRAGTFPVADVTWQYPPAAALAILSPGALPFLGYATAFFVLALVCDAAVLGLLLTAARRPGRSVRGVWVWVAGVPLLGPTAYARYDLMVTAVAVAALLAGVRRPRAMGALVALGALVKVWPVLLLAGVARARVWWSAGLVAGAVLAVSALVPGAFGFLTHQRDRGTEVESLGALVFHVRRLLGDRETRVLLNYGSIEFVGPGVPVVSAAALLLAVAALGWLVAWRLRARAAPRDPGPAGNREPADLTPEGPAPGCRTPEGPARGVAAAAWPGPVADAALTAVLLFTTTSRVISPQYLLWPTGLAAVCLLGRRAAMTGPAVLVLLASAVTVVEFPLLFGRVVASDPVGVALLVLRNGLLVAATVWACRRLWRSTVPYRGSRTAAVRPGVSPAAAADSPASAR